MTNAGRLSRFYHGISRVVIVFMISTIAMPTAQADTMPGGIGGTGLQPGGIGGTGFQPGGIGGTGLQLGGIGGTGLQPGGIGGTGIVAAGPIQRFGSIFVLGKEYHFTPQTKFVIDGAASTKQRLRLGSTVVVTGKWEKGHWIAQQVEADSALIGRIDRIDTDRRDIQILGQTVKITPQTRLYPGNHLAASSLQSLQPGDMIQMSALGHGPDGWTAATVTRIPSDVKAPAYQASPLLLRGSIQALAADRQTVRIGGTWFTLAKPLAARFAIGQNIMASGHYASDGPLLTQIKQDSNTAAGVGRHIELYGRIWKSAEGVYCNNYRLEENSTTPPERNAHPSTGWGVVEGLITAPGVIRSDRIIPLIDPMAFDLSAGHDQQGARQEEPTSKSDLAPPNTDHGTEQDTIKTPDTSPVSGDLPTDGGPDASPEPSTSPALPEPGVGAEPPDGDIPSAPVTNQEPADLPDISPPSVPSVPSVPTIPSIPSIPSPPEIPEPPSESLE